jgi:hypothetical protein
LASFLLLNDEAVPLLDTVPVDIIAHENSRVRLYYAVNCVTYTCLSQNLLEQIIALTKMLE